ncbi:hypothetical protein BKA64DRAFT_562229 [Cadophora sp. MPI-SDFR-AT-0126]|nr:hypothetical protein BKA64DRAFT_562229 [Leotiomycetes sp. MPI-SDFR-AT-0126]
MRAYISQQDMLDLKTVRNGTNRVIVPLTHGTVEGSGLKATITQGGSDSMTQDTKLGIAHIDVRTQARTDDGQFLFIYYTGVLKIDEAVAKVLTGAKDAKSTEFGDLHWFVAPIIETSDEKFKWVENTLFVAEGRLVVDEQGSAVEYQIFKVSN